MDIHRYRYFILIALMAVSGPVLASDILMVEYPLVIPGEAELFMQGGSSAYANAATGPQQAQKIGAGYGFGDVWSSEIAAEYEGTGDAQGDAVAPAYELDNLLRLGRPGLGWADWALDLEYTRAGDVAGADSYKLMPIMQKRFEDGMLTMNFGFEHNPDQAGTSNLQFNYAWQYLWPGEPDVHFCLEGYGGLGDALHWSSGSQQTHRLGPVLIGSLGEGSESNVHYRLGLYFGLTEATAKLALMSGLEYEL